MEVSLEVLLNTIREQTIYHFAQNPPAGIANHYHLCVKLNENYLLFGCLTSQENTMNRLIQLQGLDPCTIVAIKKDESNSLPKDWSYINCNNVYQMTADEFHAYYREGNVSFKGELSASDYYQVLIGIKQSRLVATEIKELIPDID
ncbi:MAG: hypothetical protein RL662_1447 [Bacteroidota bacterium]|jgi:hypothetical protein